MKKLFKDWGGSDWLKDISESLEMVWLCVNKNNECIGEEEWSDSNWGLEELKRGRERERLINNINKSRKKGHVNWESNRQHDFGKWQRRVHVANPD